MRTRNLYLVAALAALPLAFSVQSFAASSSSVKPTMQATITMAQAKKIALKAFPGHILHRELEHEKGGSGLRYSFDIKHGTVVHEVGVDAMTGKVLENDVDSDSGKAD